MLLNHSISSLGIEELIRYLKKKPLDLVLLQGVEFRDFWRGDRQYLFFPFSFPNDEEARCSLLVHKKLLTARFYQQEKFLNPSVLSYKGPLRGKDYYQSLFSSFKLSDDPLNVPYYIQFLRVKESKEAFLPISFHALLKRCLHLVDQNSRVHSQRIFLRFLPSENRLKIDFSLLKEKSLDLNYLLGSSIRKSLKKDLLQEQLHLLQQKKSAYKVERFYASKFNPWHTLQNRCKIPTAYLPLTLHILRIRFIRLLGMKYPEVFHNKPLLRGVIRLFSHALKAYGRGSEEFLGQNSYTSFKAQIKTSGDVLNLSHHQKNLFLSLAREALKAPEIFAFLSLIKS